MTRCGHCPRAGEPFCLGSRSPIVCRRRDPGDPMRDEAFDAPLAGEDGAIKADGPPPATVTYGVPLSVNLAVLQCPVRGVPIECGCAAEKRYCGETLDLMVWGGCVACKASEATDAAAEPVGP